MALQDILDSIAADADGRIAEAKAEHKKRMKIMHEESEHAVNQKRFQLIEQRDQKKRQLTEKAESHARMVRTKALLAKKQEYMDKMYADVLAALIALPKDKTEKFLEQCLKHIKGKGTILPAKAHEAMLKKMLPDGCEMGKAIDASGGFKFESEKEEHDFTYEFLVHGLLRPQTEVKLAQDLFPASH
jgi:vacuolar-type H+-ATPase subunit E/Vma4